MTGRQENENRIDNHTKEALQTMPKIINRYYTYFKSCGHTAISVWDYVYRIKDYLDYLKYEEFYDVEDVEDYKAVKPVDITTFLEYYRTNGKKDKSESACATMFYAIKSFYSFMVDNEYLSKNPCDNLKAPKVNLNQKPTVMTKKEVERVKNYILNYEGTFYNYDTYESYWRLRDYLIFTLGCRTGLRCTAIASINVSDINMDDQTITVVEKGNFPRIIYFGKDTKKIIEKWLTARKQLLNAKDALGGTKTDALFVSRRSPRITQSSIGRMIKKYTSAVIKDKKISPHKMRSTCATLLWEQTHDIYMVADQLGHHNLTNTKRYTDISTTEKQKVANILDKI